MPPNIDELKRVAQIRTSESGESIAEIPLPLWENVLLQLDRQPSHIEQIDRLLQEWEKDSQNDMPDSWWDNFQSFLRVNRLELDDLETGDE